MRNASHFTILGAFALFGLTACGGGGSDDGGGGGGGGGGGNSGGLDSRPSNTSCLAGAETTGGALALTQVYTNLSFTQPVQILQPPNDATRWFVVEKTGTIKVFPNQSNVTSSQVTTFLTIPVDDRSESGLLSMAFHPSFPTDRRVFVYYINAAPRESRLSIFRTNAAGTAIDSSGGEQVLFRIPRNDPNHNGGQIAFGQDGNLYIGTGDGGHSNDVGPGHSEPKGNGQDTQTLLGKMLRINVGNASSNTYTTPSDNMFTGTRCTTGSTGASGCPEIYAFGFRNPWRWSFDRASGDLWLADVGQSAWEEVNKVVRGGNYGWRCREGANPLLPDSCGNPPASSLIDPVIQYGRASGSSITGGFVYRGSAIPSLVGRYVFGDYGSGNIWNVSTSTEPTLTVTGADALATGRSISAFGQDNSGELYVVDLFNGRLYQLTQGSGGTSSVANQLSATGCAAASNATQPASGMIPYEPNAGFWSDGAQKTRWLALPDGTTINTTASDGDWDLPNGSVLRKDFHIGSRLVETRLFMRHTNGNWAGYTYEWNTAGTDAVRVVGGKQVTISGQTWIFPSESQCLTCHTAAAGRSLGLETAQLNGDVTYPATGRTANQLTTLSGISMLNPRVTVGAGTPKLPDPYDSASGGVTERARAWLHTNCAFCHRPGGTAPGSMDLRYSASLAQTNTCNAAPEAGDLGLPNARIISPGSPGSSVLLERIERRDSVQMPPLASTRVDDEGVQLIQSWIQSMSGC